MRIPVALLILCSALSLPAWAQFTTPQQADQATPVDIPNKAPDMVCFGEGPNWSIQLQQGRGRRLGINQPDSFYNGKFVWVPAENLWNWTGENANGQGDHLVVTINKKSLCRQPAQAAVPLQRANHASYRRHCLRLLPQAEAGRGCGWSGRPDAQQAVVQQCFHRAPLGIYNLDARSDGENR